MLKNGPSIGPYGTPFSVLSESVWHHIPQHVGGDYVNCIARL